LKMALKLYTFPGNPRANKALIAAKYNGVDVTIPAGFVMGETNRTPEFLALNPLGKVPTLETPEGGIFESNAIARYVGGLRADTQLLGGSYFESGQVSMWMDFVTTHLDLPVSNWVYQILGWMQFNPQITKKAQADVLAALKVVDGHLLSNSFLVGSCITLADITMVCSLDLAYRMVFEPKYREMFPNVTRWFLTCVNQPEFVAIMGEVTLCAKTMEAKAPAKEKQEKKAKAPKEAKAPKAKAPKDDGEEPTPKPASKDKNPLDLLPKSSMVMDEWKRQYSNNDTPVAMDWLWKNFDPEGYCWYWVHSKYAKEQTKSWQAANLLGGFLQRWEPCRKYCFGTMLIMGEDKPGGMVIEGAMMFRGQDIIQEFKDIPDFETFDLKPIDITSEAEKKLLGAYLAWGEFGTAGDLPGECLDGKEFK